MISYEHVTPDQVREVAATARPYAVALLWWGPQRHRDGADAIELEHQRRMVALRDAGTIAVLCPADSERLAGVAVMVVDADEATAIMAEDPCVRADMIRAEVYRCYGFPGDALPGEDPDTSAAGGTGAATGTGRPPSSRKGR